MRKQGQGVRCGTRDPLLRDRTARILGRAVEEQRAAGADPERADDVELDRDGTPSPRDGGMAANGGKESAMPSVLQRTTALPRNTPRLAEKQKADTTLVTIRRGLLERRHGPVGEGHVEDYKNVLLARSAPLA